MIEVSDILRKHDHQGKDVIAIRIGIGLSAELFNRHHGWSLGVAGEYQTRGALDGALKESSITDVRN